MHEKLTAIILAAGASKRFNNKIEKPFIKLNNKPLLWYSLYSFEKCPAVNEIYIVASKNRIELMNLMLKKYFSSFKKLKGIIAGGERRQDSVLNALLNIKKCNYIAIHDSARPFIKVNIIHKLFVEAYKYKACAPGISPVDTIKKINRKGFLSEHLIRNSLIAIQTPQVFKFDRILNAYKKSIRLKKEFTDDTEIYSLLYDRVKIIEGDKDLIKVTFNEDLKTAKLILRNNKGLWK